MKKEMVHHPDHYQGAGGLEVWDVINAFTAGLSGVEAFDTGNIIKYACRWSHKNGVEDLKKVVEYANHLIKHLEATAPGPTSIKEKGDLADMRCFIDSLTYPDRDSAMHIVRDIRAIYEAQGVVTIQDFCDYMNIECPFNNAQNYGWDNLCLSTLIRSNDYAYSRVYIIDWPPIVTLYSEKESK